MRFLMLNWRDPRNPLAGGAERVTHAYLCGLVERGSEQPIVNAPQALGGAASISVRNGGRVFIFPPPVMLVRFPAQGAAWRRFV